MAKPILLIRIDHAYQDSFTKISKATRLALQDEYHVLVLSQETKEPIFEVYNVDKEPEIKYSELKKLINKEVEV